MVYVMYLTNQLPKKEQEVPDFFLKAEMIMDHYYW